MAGKEDFPVYPGWETVRKIGNGSFGAVYEIQRNLFGTVETAALKQISIPQDQGDVEELYSTGYDDASITAHYESYLADIVKEYQLMAEMKGHTNVVYCDDIRYIQKDSGIGWDIYIKMELLTPMMKMLDKLSDEKQILKLGKDLSGALVLCRSRNIIHRDIKPQNIFISKDGDFKLGDFGIAKTAEKTSGGTKIGTYNYMAPEVYNNQPYGHGADIYSLGLVLYWLLNNRRLPFYPAPPAIPKASDMESARLRRFRGDVIPAPAHGSEELKRIVLKACAYDPKDRYQTAEEMLQDLDALSAAENTSASMRAPVGGRIAAPAEADNDGTVGVYRRPSAFEPVFAHSERETNETASAFKTAAASSDSAVTAESPAIAVPEGSEIDGTVGLFKSKRATTPEKDSDSRPFIAPVEREIDGTVGLYKAKAAAAPVKTAGDADRRAPVEQEIDVDGTVGVLQKPKEFQTPSDKTPVPAADPDAVKTSSVHQPVSEKEPEGVMQPAETEKSASGDKKKTGLAVGIVGAIVLALILLIVLLPKSGSGSGSDYNAYTPGSSSESVESTNSNSDADSAPEQDAFAEGDWDWTLADGVLTIYGSGNMKNYEDPALTPWWDIREQITRVVIEEGITGVGDYAFYGCPNMTSVDFPASLNRIGYSAFYVSDLNYVAIPAGVNTIGDYAFCDCLSLTNIDVDPDNPSYCSVDGVLYDKEMKRIICYPSGSERTSFSIPYGVLSIENEAFIACTNLTSVEIPYTVASIGECAFGWCSKLTSVSIAENVVNIGKYAFIACSFSSISIPASVLEIGVQAFDQNDNLSQIIVDSQNKNYCITDGVLFSKDMTRLLCCPPQKTAYSYSVPEGVTEIDPFAFRSCSFSVIDIPYSVSVIGGGAFFGCTHLMSVYIPSGVPEIRNLTFFGCDNLSTVSIPSSVTCIGWQAFDYCSSLTTINYEGDADQWDSIEIYGNNDPLLNAAVNFNRY